MEQDRTIQLRVGIFVTAGLLLAMLVIFMIGSERSWFEKKYKIYATFGDVSGLGPGVSVSLAGMRVGSVTAVLFPRELEQKHLIVEMEIAKQFRERIRKDSRASIATQGLLGDKQIVISVGGPGADPLGDGDQIETEVSGDLFSLGENARQFLNDGRETMAAVKRMVDMAEQGQGVLHALIYDPAGEQLLRDLEAGVRALRRAAVRLEGTAGGGGLEQIIRNLETATHDARLIVDRIRRGEGTLGGLLTDSAIYHDLRALFGKTRRNVIVKSAIRSMLKENERGTVE